jgi:hypothetical protein
MADHVFSPSLLQQLKQAAVEPGEVVVAADIRFGVAAGVDPGDAMKVRVADGGIRAIGKQFAVYDDVGACVCGPALFDAVETAVAGGDSSLADAIQVLADAGVTRALTIGDEEWWFDVDTPRPPQRQPPRPANHGEAARRRDRRPPQPHRLAAGGHTRAARPLPRITARGEDGAALIDRRVLDELPRVP